jgi:hypothetical protein
LPCFPGFDGDADRLIKNKILLLLALIVIDAILSKN